MIENVPKLCRYFDKDVKDFKLRGIIKGKGAPPWAPICRRSQVLYSTLPMMCQALGRYHVSRKPSASSSSVRIRNVERLKSQSVPRLCLSQTLSATRMYKMCRSFIALRVPALVPDKTPLPTLNATQSLNGPTSVDDLVGSYGRFPGSCNHHP